jgi:hypothetical protein
MRNAGCCRIRPIRDLIAALIVVEWEVQRLGDVVPPNIHSGMAVSFCANRTARRKAAIPLMPRI